MAVFTLEDQDTLCDELFVLKRFSIALLRFVIGLKISCHFLNQSIVTWSRAFSRAWRGLHVFASYSDWFVVLFAPADIYCLHYYGQELALSLLYCLKRDSTMTEKVKISQEWQFWSLDSLSQNQIWWTVLHFQPSNHALFLQTTASVLLWRIILSIAVVYLVAFGHIHVTWK